MSKHLSYANALIALTILVIVQFGLLGVLWHRQNNYGSSNASQIDNLQKQVVSFSNGLSYQPVTVSPAENKIYLPQLNLALPLTSLGTSLVYSPDTAYVTGSNKLPSGPLDEASISTFATASAPQTQSQFNCSSAVRIKFESKPDPYNPHEVPSGSVNLANGKTLQIYANHLKDCQPEWAMTGTDPDAIAALFRQAQSY